jgi:hypothetical protein
MADVRLLTLERALDDWISDLDMQGDYQSEGGLERGDAYAAMVRQATDWISRGVLVPGELAQEGFSAWPGSPAENARRFAEAASQRSEVQIPGDISWFDTGPATGEEFDRLTSSEPHP